VRSVQFKESTVTDSDLTVSILRDIRDRLTETNARLNQTNARLEHQDVRLGVIEETLRGMASELFFVGSFVKNRMQKELRDLKTRVTKLERKVG
jgi:hypothetical protein